MVGIDLGQGQEPPIGGAQQRAEAFEQLPVIEADSPAGIFSDWKFLIIEHVDVEVDQEAVEP